MEAQALPDSRGSPGLGAWYATWTGFTTKPTGAALTPSRSGVLGYHRFPPTLLPTWAEWFIRRYGSIAPPLAAACPRTKLCCKAL